MSCLFGFIPTHLRLCRGRGFFVVSGFCIHLSHQRSKDKGWLLFINRRFFRIYPPYLLAICTFFFLWPWGSFSIDTYSRALQLGTHLLAVHNFNGQTASGINFSFWSIAIEIQLYAIYPLMLFITRKAGWRRGLFVIALIEILIRSSQSVLGVIMGVTLPRYLISTPFTFWFSWAIGAYLAECFITKQSGGLSA